MECKFIWEEERKPKRNYKDYQYTTTYPTDKILKEKFQTSEQISAFLLRNAQEIGYCKWQLFQKSIIDEGDHMKIIYSCRSKLCDAELVYNQKKVDIGQQGQYSKKYYLSRRKIINSHNHPLKLTRKLANQQNIRQYLFDLPVEQKFQNHVEVVKERFKLSRCQARYLKDRVFWRFRDQDHMLSKLTERRVTFRRKVQDGKSSILLLISQPMKKNYEKYGDMLCFDITYKLLMRKKEQVRHTGIGFFIGQDENSRMVLFGVAVIQQQSSDHFYQLFQYFFEMVGSVPQTILTDDQRAIGNALQRLKIAKKFKYIHLLDWYHKLTAVKRCTKRQTSRQELFTLFNRLLKQPSKKIYRDIVGQIAGMLQKQQVMRDFLRDQKQCCLSQIPEKFFGFGISSTRAEGFNRLIKRSVPIQTNLGRLIFFVLRVQKRLMNRMAVLNYMNEELVVNMPDEQIRYLHEKLECLAFQQVRQYFHQSRQFVHLQMGASPNARKVTYIKYERRYYFSLMYDLRDGCWRCQCKNNFRTGMPCSHLVRVIRQYGGLISYYINQRWYHTKENAQVKKPTRPSIKDKRI